MKKWLENFTIAPKTEEEKKTIMQKGADFFANFSVVSFAASVYSWNQGGLIALIVGLATLFVSFWLAKRSA